MEPRLGFFLQEYGLDKPDVEVPRDVFDDAIPYGSSYVEQVISELSLMLAASCGNLIEVTATMPAQVYRPDLTVYRATIVVKIV